MIPQAKIDQVRELLAAGGLSHRTIAKTTGLSRATIARVADGSRIDQAPKVQRPFDDIGPVCRGHGLGQVRSK